MIYNEETKSIKCYVKLCNDNSKYELLLNISLLLLPAAISVTVTQVTGGDRHSFHLGNLKPGNGYYFRVRGINALGIGEASRSSGMLSLNFT